MSGQGYGEEDVTKFPSKPIMFIMPVPPGGTIELGCRLITKEAEKSLKQPIVMVNKPGSALTVGTAALASAKPDGYTIGFSGGPPLFLAALLEKVPYDLIKDIRTIIQIETPTFRGRREGRFFLQDGKGSDRDLQNRTQEIDLRDDWCKQHGALNDGAGRETRRRANHAHPL